MSLFCCVTRSAPPAVTELPYRSRSKKDVNDVQIELIPAGRLKIEDDDEYVFWTYNNSVNLISVVTEAVGKDYQMLLKAHERKLPLSNELMRCNMSNDALLRCYRDFFCNSAYKIDDFVQVRKDIAVDGRSIVKKFKENLEAISDDDGNNEDFFSIGIELLAGMDKSANALLEHYYSTCKKIVLEKRGNGSELTEKEKDKLGLVNN